MGSGESGSVVTAERGGAGMLGWEAHSSTATTVPMRDGTGSGRTHADGSVLNAPSNPTQGSIKVPPRSAKMPDMQLHPDLAEIAPLVGTWRGSGRGTYPTIEPFEYTEEVVFAAPVLKPFLVYTQRTRHADTGEPLHTETGYLRTVEPGRVELVIAQPTGVAEVHAGTVSAGRIDLRSEAIALTPTAKEVVTVHRHLVVDGDVLRYRLEMGALGQAHQLHLEAELRRTD